MKIALIGYGSMGKTVEALAKEKGHEIVFIATSADAVLSEEELAKRLKQADVAIDFSVPVAVKRNVASCLLAEIPLVEGTTGWNSEFDSIKMMVERSEGALIFSANFSIGVNIFYKLVSLAAQLFSKFPEYDVFIEERHHHRKKDSPSGTALKLKQIISESIEKSFSISSTRAGEIPGTHLVGFDSKTDTIELTHTARSRQGFALGAIFAAEWIQGKKGFYEFSQIINISVL
jgi:4-hydroxy-tetrahydrodipicolinate reductase